MKIERAPQFLRNYTAASTALRSLSYSRQRDGAGRWVRAVSSPERKNAVGTIAAVIPDDLDSLEFTMYDIKFSFGMMTLHGTQIEGIREQQQQRI